MRGRSSLLANPPRKVLSREQVEKKQRKAVAFLRDVVGDDDLADEIYDLSVEEYAEKKRITLENPNRTDQEIIEHVLSEFPPQVSREELVRARRLGQEALEELPPDATEIQELQTARDAIAPVADDCQQRLRSERLLPHVSIFLPLLSSERDEEEGREIVGELLEELPASMADFEVQARIRRALAPLSRKIEQRNRLRQLIEHGRCHVGTVLSKMYHDGEIDGEVFWDSGFREKLEQTAVHALRQELTGSESNERAEEIVESVLEEELPEEDEDGEEDGGEEDDQDEEFEDEEQD